MLDHPNDYPALKCDVCSMSFLSENRYQEHLKESSCKTNLNNSLILKQITSTN